MIFDELRLIDDPFPGDGAWNMAVDEMLTEGCLKPILRVYRWVEPTVTVGYFEKIQWARHLRPGLPLMRRWTGGGLVDHGADWTYSFILPTTHTWARGTRGGSYRAIHEAIRNFVKTAHGISLEWSEAENEQGEGCFARPVPGDLLWNGQKIAGAAQRRTRHFLLHQGSVQNVPFQTRDALQLALGLAQKVETTHLTESEKNLALELVASRYGQKDWLERF